MIKVYVDGFKIDEIEMPGLGDDELDMSLADRLDEVCALAFTDKVKTYLGDEPILTVTPVPIDAPKFVMIYTI